MFGIENDENSSRRVTGRRAFLAAAGVGLVGAALWLYRRPMPAAAEPLPAGPPKMVTIVEFTDAGERKDVVTVPMIRKTDAEWKAQLSPDSFEVARREGTERPFSGELLNVHDKGVFRCICCDTALFSSATIAGSSSSRSGPLRRRGWSPHYHRLKALISTSCWTPLRKIRNSPRSWPN